MTSKFKWLLREEGHTQESWAKAMGMGRARLCQALGNVPGRGGVRRPQIVAWIREHFKRNGAEMLQELGWVERSTGNVPPGGTMDEVDRVDGVDMTENND